MATVNVREATSRDELGVRQVLDGAMLEVDDGLLERRLAAGSVLVAEAERRVLGALVAVPREDGAHVEAVAVRRRRRAQGIGSDLLERAAERWRPLTANFDPGVRPFYESLGFDVRERGNGRYRGRLD